jgi:hypothetical protein
MDMSDEEFQPELPQQPRVRRHKFKNFSERVADVSARGSPCRACGRKGESMSLPFVVKLAHCTNSHALEKAVSLPCSAMEAAHVVSCRCMCVNFGLLLVLNLFVV